MTQGKKEFDYTISDGEGHNFNCRATSIAEAKGTLKVAKGLGCGLNVLCFLLIVIGIIF